MQQIECAELVDGDVIISDGVFWRVDEPPVNDGGIVVALLSKLEDKPGENSPFEFLETKQVEIVDR